MNQSVVPADERRADLERNSRDRCLATWPRWWSEKPCRSAVTKKGAVDYTVAQAEDGSSLADPRTRMLARADEVIEW